MGDTTAMTTYKVPPKFTENLSYETWVKEVKLWAICNSKVAKKELGPALVLSLEGRAREAALELDISVLNADDGLDKVIGQLDGLYLRDTNQLTYAAYSEFEKYKRPTDASINDFVSDFERKYNKVKAKKIELPDAVLAYRLLDSANLPSSKVELIMATISSLTYQEMLKQLRKLEDIALGSSEEGSSSSTVTVKSEPADTFYTTRGGNRGGFRGVMRGIGAYSRRARGGLGLIMRGAASGRGFIPKAKVEEDDVPSAKKNAAGNNPCDTEGRPNKCFICKSIKHYARNCPHREEASNEEVCIEENITLFAKGLDPKLNERLLGETLGCGVLDSGCFRNVCSDIWLQEYIKTLSDYVKSFVVEKETDARFRFGDGSVFVSSKKVIIPVQIGEKRVMLETDVIDNKIPLLFSKSAMKKAETVIDFKLDKVSMFGKNIELIFTSTGHYVVPLNRNCWRAHSSSIDNDIFISSSIDIPAAKSDKQKIAMKVHKQFSHAYGSRLKKLFEDGGVTDNEMLKIISEIDDKCDTCMKFKKPPLKPVVCLPMAKVFNQSVAMDLKTIESIQIIHLIDHATRFSAGQVVSSKKREVIILAVLKVWVAYFGPPHKILTDNGGEFSNEDYRIMGEKLNTKITATAAEAPWSNGTNERHNAILGDMILKVKNDTNCSVEVALTWAISAKNALANVYGFSPNQLVYGRNPNFPSVLIDKLPALDEVSNNNGDIASKMLLENLNALHSARRAFISAESSEKIKRALVRKTRTATSLVYENGESVYYKRDGEPAWKGPGTVIGKDGSVVVVKHGSSTVRVHPSRLMHENSEFAINTTPDQNAKVAEVIDRPASPGVVTEHRGGDVVVEDEVDEVVPRSEEASNRNGNEGNEREEAQSFSGAKLPKKNVSVIAKMADGSNKNYQIISRAGKATGKYADFLNVFDTESKEGKCIDWKNDVQEWKESSVQDVMLSTFHNSPDLLNAKFEELRKWQEYDVYEVVDKGNQDVITVRWVCTMKEGKMKARLVARGFEDAVVQTRTDSPTCSKMNLRLVMAITASKGWSINSLDIQSAFLQGKDVERDIFLQPPKEANCVGLWKLKKYVYGLNEAARMWYLRVSEELEKLNVSRSKLDEAIFFWRVDGVVHGLIAAHVDDFFWSGTNSFRKKIIDSIRNTFKISSEAENGFTFLGIDVVQTDEVVGVNQNDYCDNIAKITISHTEPGVKGRALSNDEKTELRRVIGQLQWLSTQTRPDLAYDACELSNSFTKATSDVLFRANKSITKAKLNSVQINFQKLSSIEECKIVVFSDASFKNLPGGGSQGGYLLFLVDKSGRCSPVHWQSHKLKRIVASSLAAECLALQDGSGSAFYLKSLIEEIFESSVKEMPVCCITDNKSLVETVHSSNTLEDKRLIVDIAMMREKLRNKEIASIEWIEKTHQLADCLTKKQASSEKLRDVLRNGRLKIHL